MGQITPAECAAHRANVAEWRVEAALVAIDEHLRACHPAVRDPLLDVRLVLTRHPSIGVPS